MIGQGSFGKVYLVRHMNNQVYAMKQLSKAKLISKK
jgi:serine/threonine protein kinase